MERLIPVVAIVGPTAVGKTTLGVALSERLGGEIISADSRQVYRRMDIGTAKALPEELSRAPHHLIDVVEPDEPFGLADFLRLAREAVLEIAGRGRLPLLVGGTGQYVKALLEGWQVPEVPPDPDLRAELERQGQADPDALWGRLMALDPDAAEFVDRPNLRRVIRALEVCLKSGQPFSVLRRSVPPPYRVMRLGLTMPRAELYARADARVRAMVAAGLLDEIARLREAGYAWELPSLSGLGYIQFRPYFEGKGTLEQAVERTQLDTHDFIRRQYTWFRPADPQIRWLEAGAVDLESLVDELREGMTERLE